MKVKVIKLFRDKYTGNLHKPNEILEVTTERYHEMNGTARGIFVEEIEKANTKLPDKVPTEKKPRKSAKK